MRGTILACLLSALLVPAHVAAQQQPRRTRVTVTGLVLDSVTGLPVPMATVTLREGRRVVFTDSAGHFEVSAAITAAEQVQVRQIGYTPVAFHADIGADSPPFLIYLTPDPVPLEQITARARRDGLFTIEGTVVDSLTGRPLPRVVVWFDDSHGNAVTDSVGHYVYDGAHAGFVDVVVDVLGYRRRAATRQISEPWQRLDFALAPDPLVLEGIIALGRQLRHSSVQGQGFRHTYSESELAASSLRTPTDFLQWAQALPPPGVVTCLQPGLLKTAGRPRWAPFEVPLAGPLPQPGILILKGDRGYPLPRIPANLILNGKEGNEATLPAPLSDFYQAVAVRTFRCDAGVVPTVVFLTKSYLRKVLRARGLPREALPPDSLEARLVAVDSLR